MIDLGCLPAALNAFQGDEHSFWTFLSTAEHDWNISLDKMPIIFVI
jgi:hypothetical protein